MDKTWKKCNQNIKIVAADGTCNSDCYERVYNRVDPNHENSTDYKVLVDDPPEILKQWT